MKPDVTELFTLRRIPKNSLLMYVTIFFSTPIITIVNHLLKCRNIMHKDPPRTHKTSHAKKNTSYTYNVTLSHVREHVMYLSRNTEARAGNYPWRKKRSNSTF